MPQIAFYSHLFGALFYLGTGLLLCFHKSTRQQIPLLILGAFLTSVWCVLATIYQLGIFPYYSVVALSEILQDGVWCFCAIQLINLTQKFQSKRWYNQISFRSLFTFLLLALCANAFFMQTQWQSADKNLYAQFSYIGNIATSVIALALIEQLYMGTAPERRWRIKFIAIGLGLIFCYDLYMFANALLLKHINPTLWEMRGGVCALVAPIIAWGVFRNRNWQSIFMPSRKLIFSSTAFISCGIYLLAMALVGYALRQFGGNWGKALQVLFLTGSVLLLAMLLTSGSVRASFTQFFAKNIFKLRYDYRQEWLGLSNVLSQVDQKDLYELTIKSVADLVESPKGWIFKKTKENQFELISSWNIELPDEPFLLSDPALCKWLETSKQPILVPKEPQHKIDAFSQLPWLWLLVPFKFVNQCPYVVALAHPRTHISINWEVQDILMMVGRQLAVTLVQSENAKALAVAKQFEAFNQVSAFLAHDLKNIAAQLIMIKQNKEKHGDNPKFVESVYKTIDNLHIKLDKLLKQFVNTDQNQLEKVKLNKVVKEAVALREHSDPKPHLNWQVEEDDIEIAGDSTQLINVLCHLIENAQQATAPFGKIFVNITVEGKEAIIKISDTGKGMSSDFIRNDLFKPFVSTKGRKGMGIGTYQAKTYIEKHHGRIEVSSKEGEGTQFSIYFPILHVVRQNNMSYLESDIITQKDKATELEI